MKRKYILMALVFPFITYLFLFLVHMALPVKKVPANNFFPLNDFLNIAHRGGRGIAPENTLYAFSNALKVGADVLEMDVHLTKDNHLVVIHDETVARTTDKTGEVKNFTLKAIKELDAAYRFQENNQFPLRKTGITIPTLEEVFSAFPKVRMVVEIKPREAVNLSTQKMCELLTKYNRLDLTLIAAFSNDTIAAFREVCPAGQTVSPLEDSLEFLFLHKLNLLDFYSPDHIAFEIPPSVFESISIYTPAFLKEANQRNISVHLWTINDEKEMQLYIADGAQGILTDYPDKLEKLLP